MPETRSRGYVAAQVGALLGVVPVVVLSFVAFQVLVMPSLFQEHRPLEVWGVSSVSACVLGAVVGCAVALALVSPLIARAVAVRLQRPVPS